MTGALDETLLEEVRSAVLLAGRLIRENLDKPKSVTLKGRIDLVTETDPAVEEMLKTELARILPGSDFLAEESSGDTVPGEATWIIDPLDGTTNFAHGLPLVATSVGLWRDGRVVLAVVNLPVLGEVYTAALGRGAFKNGRPIRVSPVTDLSESLVATGFPYSIHENVDQVLANMRKFLLRTQGMRRPGAAALDLAWVAEGRYEGFYEPELKPWDTAAGWLLVEEAGGRVSQFDAREPYRLGAPTILASNGALHEIMSSLLLDE